jgi:Na+/H+ antiporter NhaC
MEVSETHTESTLLQKIKTTVLTLAVFALVIFLAIFFMGSQSQHRDNHNFLYDCFDTSSDHASLLSQLSKSRLSILFGRKEAGLFQFA